MREAELPVRPHGWRAWHGQKGLDAAEGRRIQEEEQAMKLSTKGLAMASGILWGAAMLGMGLANLIWSSYGQQFLQTMASVYPGYHATRSVAEVIVGTLYGFVDGLIAGAVFAWLYNQFATPGA
jgi:hypothetical protein